MGKSAERFRTVKLGAYLNSAGTLRPRKGAAWHSAAAEMAKHMPRGRISSWGIPFVVESGRRRLIELANGTEVSVPLDAKARYICFLHFANIFDGPPGGGEHLADYIVKFRDGTEQVQPIRRRFEINPLSVRWGSLCFDAQSINMHQPLPPGPRAAWGYAQTGLTTTGYAFGAWVHALEVVAPDKEIESVTLRSVATEPVGILAITLYNGPGHPLRHVQRRLYKLTIPAKEKTTTDKLRVELDMGTVVRLFAAPGKIDDKWVSAVEKGLGKPRSAPAPSNEFLFEAVAAEGATVSVKLPRRKPAELPFQQAFNNGRATSPDRRVRIELLQPSKTWVHVTVVDSSTGRPTPTRAHFSGPNGEYLAPYGHHEVVNENWFEDYGGDLKLGDMSYAYVPGRFQILLPPGTVYVELAKGFEYAPLRRKLEIRPGQRELTLSIDRRYDLRRLGWMTADTHVHFISPQTAWLEGQCEGLNLINLLASQWGRLFTNVADITGELSGCSKDDTLVWVGTENRNHLLGHISLLGAKGDPIFPMCAGGPDEAWLGDPDVTTLTEWARRCKEQDGVVIRPHFPFPVCEEPVYFLSGQLDAAELRSYANPDSGTLDELCFKEWYRYLNCGCRVAAVGGTDKMSAGMPVGGARTYAKLLPDDPLTFESWARAVRAGRTFTSSGPLIDLEVDGHSIGDEIRLPHGGGTVEVAARAECLWPINALEVVVNGKVVAGATSKAGAQSLEIREKVKLAGSSWIAARCGSRLVAYHCWPIHLGAHTSPIYVVAGADELFNPSDATYMLTLIDGGLTYLDRLSVRFSEERHRQLKAVYEGVRARLAARLGMRQ